MRLLIVGGTGLISSEFANAAAARGDQLTLVTRGRSRLQAPGGASFVHADATDPAALRAALDQSGPGGGRFDAVVQFIAFDAQHVADDVETFAERTDQYVLVATSAAYQKHERLRPLTEDVPHANPHWQYARDKIACERTLRAAAAEHALGFTIVRPAHTYGPSKIPAFTGNSRHPWTIVDRMRAGRDIVVPGDGTSLWTVTHARDVAAGMLGLLGNPRANGEAVHVTSDEALTWTGIYRTIARAAGLDDERFERQVVHVPSAALVAARPDQEGSIRGDKMHPAVYDNSKLRDLVPGFRATTTFEQGMVEAVRWFEADASRQTIDDDWNATFDRLATIYRGALQRAGEV